MKLTSEQQKLSDFVTEWSKWKPLDNGHRYYAWSDKQNITHYFTIEALNSIDERIIPVLSFTGDASQPKHPIHERLRNSVFIWNHPERILKFLDQTLYWQNFVSIEVLDNGNAHIMFSAPADVYTLPDGTLVASADGSMPNREMPWSFWEQNFPGIQKFVAVAQTMDMDDYEIAEYCESMLFKEENIEVNTSLELPNNLSSGTSI